MAKKFRHNKRRNAALLHEFLIRHISKCLINNKNEEVQKTVSLSKKYFSKGRTLNEELALFNAIFNNKVASRDSAKRILNEVAEKASKLNARRLDIEKSKLIKEINHTLGNAIYGYKIPNYTVYASAQTLFSEARTRRKSISPIDKIKLEDTIIEHLVRSNDNTSSLDQLKINPKYSNAVYKFVIERFHKKYADKLTQPQRGLLTKYAVSAITENVGPVKSAIEKEVAKVKAKLKEVRDNQTFEKKELMSKINECYKKIVTTDFSEVNDDVVLEVLQYMSLSEEIDS